MNFQSSSDRLRRRMSIISRFDDLEKCSGTAERSGAFKAGRNRIFGKCGPLQQLCTARQANFPLVPVDFGNAELGQLLRDHVRVRFQRRNSVGGRERVEFAAPDRLENLLEFPSRNFLQPLRKGAREYGDVLRVCAKRLAKVVVLSARSLANLEGGDQIFGLFVLVQKFERAREINAGDIILPYIGLMLVEIILQIKNVICGDDAFTGEHVNPVSDGSRLGQGRGLARDHLLQIAQAAREHVRWRSKAGCFRRAQEIHYVNRIETDLLVGFRRPITERALIVLPASQNSKDFLDLCICLRATEPEIGLVREQEPA